jgi:phage protein D
MKGAPDAKAEAVLQAIGFRSYIDGDWLITRAVHTLDSGGYQTKIEAEPLK